MNQRLKMYVYAAMMVALTCVATMIIKVPTIGTNGYVNIGDSMVLLSAWLLGNPFGAIAAGLGSGLADLLSGYPVYVPGTTIIKFAMAFVGYIVYRALRGVKAPNVVAYLVSGITAELIMVGGYLLYEATLLGYGAAAVLSVPSNFVQAGVCLALGLIMIVVLIRIPFFAHLREN